MFACFLLERHQNKVAELETELATRVMQTKQFQDLKKMLVKKNQQMKDIRSRLQRYEPSAPAAADDDDSD
jgi:leucine zipper transcription factor-like protein 1